MIEEAKNVYGAKIKVHRSLTDGEEGRFVAGEIFEQKMRNQMMNGQFAILYRTNAQSRAMEDALRKRDIPYRIYGGLSFYQRKEIKDVLAYLRLVINPKDEVDYLILYCFELAEKFGESIDNVSMEALMEAIYNERHAPNARLLQQSEQQTEEEKKD